MGKSNICGYERIKSSKSSNTPSAHAYISIVNMHTGCMCPSRRGQGRSQLCYAGSEWSFRLSSVIALCCSYISRVYFMIPVVIDTLYVAARLQALFYHWTAFERSTYSSVSRSLCASLYICHVSSSHAHFKAGIFAWQLTTKATRKVVVWETMRLYFEITPLLSLVFLTASGRSYCCTCPQP